MLAGLGFGVTLGTVIISESGGSLAEPGGLLTAAGRLAGFTGAYLMLIMVVLVARLPWLEVSAGQDQLIRWHRRVAPWAFGLITAHVVLVTLGYAQAAQVGIASIDDGGMQRSQFIDEQAIRSWSKRPCRRKAPASKACPVPATPALVSSNHSRPHCKLSASSDGRPSTPGRAACPRDSSP